MPIPWNRKCRGGEGWGGEGIGYQGGPVLDPVLDTDPLLAPKGLQKGPCEIPRVEIWSRLVEYGPFGKTF